MGPSYVDPSVALLQRLLIGLRPEDLPADEDPRAAITRLYDEHVTRLRLIGTPGARRLMDALEERRAWALTASQRVTVVVPHGE